MRKNHKTKKSFLLIAFSLLTLQQTTLSQVVHTTSPPYRNIDTLKYLVLSRGDVGAYDELRFSISTWDLVPYSEVMVHQYDYYPAFTHLYVAYIALFERYKIAIPEKMRQRCNDYLKKAYMAGDNSAKTMLYVRYKNGIYLDKDTAMASLIKKNDSTIPLPPTDTLIFYRYFPNIGDSYTSFSIASGKVQSAKIIIYGQRERFEFDYSNNELQSVGACDNMESQINITNRDSIYLNKGEKSLSKDANELMLFLKKIFVEHGGQINRSGWWIFLEKY